MTLKRPIGVGVAVAPIAAGYDASRSPPRINQIRRARNPAATQTSLRTVRRPRRSIQPVAPFGRTGSTARPQRPSRAVATIHSQVGVPSGVRPPSRVVTGPAGEACTTTPAGAAASRKRGLGAASARAGAASTHTIASTETATTLARGWVRTE